MSTVRIGLRTLARSPGFAALTVATLAIGIGAATTIFSLANALFLRDLPHVEAQDRLVTLRLHDATGGTRGWSWPNLRDAAAAGTGLELAALSDRTVSLRGDGDAATALALTVTANYFETLGVPAAIGRTFTRSGDGGNDGVVLSHRAWLRHFAGDPGAVGRTARVNGVPLPVLGVLPEDFGGTFAGFMFDLWVPLERADAIAPDVDREDRDLAWLEAFARMPAGMSPSEASAAIALVGERLAAAHPAENAGIRIEARPLTGFDDEIRAGAIALTAVLLVVAVLVLAIACANVAGLLLARGAARRRELSVRLALGADRFRLIRMLLLETLLLAAAGGVLGIVLAWWAADALRAFEPPLPVAVVFDVGPDARVLAFAAALTALTVAGAGVLPALRASAPRSELLRTSAGGRERTWRSFVILQVAASLLLLTTALLFARTLRSGGAGPGFDTTNVVVAPLVDMGLARDAAEAAQAFDVLIPAVEAEPGVARAALARSIPLGLGGGSATIGVAGVEPPAGEAGHDVRYTAVTPGYFETMAIPLRRGRAFTERDRADAADVALVSDAFVRRYWPTRDALGSHVEHEGRSIEVVGVVADVRWSRSESAARPTLYLPYAQWPARRMNVLVREHFEDAGVAALRRAAAAIAPDLAAPEAVPIAQHIAISLLPQRVAGGIAGVLGGLGALLAGLGLYGLMAFTVVQRRREIGVRLAIGAGRRDIARVVLGDAIRLAGIGVAIGVAAALLAGRAIAGLLHGVSPADPIAFTGAALLALLVATVGSVAPLRRALGTAPSVTLRGD